MRNPTGWLSLLLLCFATSVYASEGWVIHEWGTFTSLQNEQGEAIGGINTDDEPVPEFVHRLADFLLLRPTEIPPIFFQGAPSCHPDVTMRLETPVVYFHPPASRTGNEAITLKVKFRGGWLTEYFPDADAVAPGLKGSRAFEFGRLDRTTESSLEWRDLKVGGQWALPKTSEHVWLSPRQVDAALVQATNGESEKFLFYRGVGHINAPLRVSRDGRTGTLLVRGQLEEPFVKNPLSVPALWLVHIRPDGNVAYRTLPRISITPNSAEVLLRTPAVFPRDQYRAANLGLLRSALQAALVKEGLFADEARALLNTWELSYFKSPGLRLFFVVPPEWTDSRLPLDASIPAAITRVMIGRIELITPEQRELLQKLASYSPDQVERDAARLRSDLYRSTASGPGWQALASGRKQLASSVKVPRTYETYLALGRFRNALILDQARRSPSLGLSHFIVTYRLDAYKPVDTGGAQTDPESGRAERR